jgi:hypothetical protein
MKKALFLLFLSFSTLAVPAQEKPLTQAEYVKMLYAVQKAPAIKADIIDALRRRGIDFQITEGIRGLTRSKTANDEEIKRALEEAGRRKADPQAARLPSAEEASELLEKTRAKTLEAVGEMPDFVVKQAIQRSAAYAGTGTFRNLDSLIVAVSYKSTGQEDYKLLSLNGAIQNNPQSKSSYEEVGGTSSTGEFVTVLAIIFKPESLTRFEPVETDLIRGRKALVYEFWTDRDRARQQIVCQNILSASAVTGIHGRVWIDRADQRVLRVESEATDIPENFPCTAARRNIDYDWTTIADEKYLLPLVSDVRVTVRDKARLFETRNLIRFKNYQKYGTEVKIVEADSEPEPEEKKPEVKKP